MFVINGSYKGNIKDELILNGYLMPTRKGFVIDGEDINNINLVNRKLSKLLVSHLVNKKFNA